jgi:hypothetical protein
LRFGGTILITLLIALLVTAAVQLAMIVGVAHAESDGGRSTK